MIFIQFFNHQSFLEGHSLIASSHLVLFLLSFPYLGIILGIKKSTQTKNFSPRALNYRLFRVPAYSPVLICPFKIYIIPIPGPPAGIGGTSSFIFATTDSVVRSVDATLVAFCNALLVTFAGSKIPAFTISTYSSL